MVGVAVLMIVVAMVELDKGRCRADDSAKHSPLLISTYRLDIDRTADVG